MVSDHQTLGQGWKGHSRFTGDRPLAALAPRWSPTAQCGVGPGSGRLHLVLRRPRNAVAGSEAAGRVISKYLKHIEYLYRSLGSALGRQRCGAY